MNKIFGDNYENYVLNREKYLYDDMWLWKHIPEIILFDHNIIKDYDEYSETRKDIGIDIVGIKNNKLYFYQCKNHTDSVTLDKLAGMLFFSSLRSVDVILCYSNSISKYISESLHTWKNNMHNKIYLKHIPYQNIIDKVQIAKNINLEIIPRQYQLDAVKQLSDFKNGLLAKPCGTGKTFTSYLIAKNYKNIIIFAPLKELTSNLLNIYYQYIQDKSIGKILVSSDKLATRDVDKIKILLKEKNLIASTYDSADVIVKIINKLTNLIIIVDEFHNLSEAQLNDTTNNMYKILNSKHKILFLSATPSKSIQFDKEFRMNWNEAVKQGLICPFNIIIPDGIVINDDKLDIFINTLEDLGEINDSTKIIIKQAYFLLRSMRFNGNKKCIAFFTMIETVNIFNNVINQLAKLCNIDVNVYIIVSNTIQKKRVEFIKNFNECDNITILLSIHILDEGIDIQKCDSVFVSKPDHDINNLVQRLSRCNRVTINKNKAYMYVWCGYRKLKDILDQINKKFVCDLPENVSQLSLQSNKIIYKPAHKSLSKNLLECINNENDDDFDQGIENFNKYTYHVNDFDNNNDNNNNNNNDNNNDNNKIKEMNEGLDLSDRIIEPYDNIDEEKEEIYNQIIKMLYNCIDKKYKDDSEISKIFTYAVNGNIKIINSNGDGFVWNSKKRLWLEKENSLLMLEIANEDYLILKAIETITNDILCKLQLCKEDKTKTKILKSNLFIIESIRDKLKNTIHVRNIWTFSKNILMDEQFKKRIINRQHDLLPIQRGQLIDLRTSLIRDRTKKDFFSFECTINYIKPEEWTDGDKKDLCDFINPIFMDETEYIRYQQIKLGSYLSGVGCRDIDINHGCGRNGKSTIIKALEIILGSGNFFGYIGKNVIVFDPKSHKGKVGGSHTSHLMPIEGKRLIVTQELEDNDTLDSEIVKKIASSDAIEGVRECHGRKTTEINPFCKLVINTNKIPNLDVNDKGMTDRIGFNPYKARFLNELDLVKEKKNGFYDESLYKYYPANGELVKKYETEGRNIDILFSWLVIGCVEYYKLKFKIPKPLIVSQYVEEKLGENDIVQMWLLENCETLTLEEWNKADKAKKKQYITPCDQLLQSFQLWAIDNGYIKDKNEYGKIKFNNNLKTKYPLRRDQTKKVFDRISLVEDDNFNTVIFNTPKKRDINNTKLF